MQVKGCKQVSSTCSVSIQSISSKMHAGKDTSEQDPGTNASRKSCKEFNLENEMRSALQNESLSASLWTSYGQVSSSDMKQAE